MKIAISGSAGIGKSTLARALAGTLRIPYIPENYELLAGKLKSAPPELAGLFNRVLELKRAEQERLGSFVADRSAVDLLNLAIRYGLCFHENEIKDFSERCRAAMAGYDLIVIPPWGVIPLHVHAAGESKMRRILNPWIQMSNHASIIGLLRMFVGEEKILYLPEGKSSQDQWLDIILKRLGKRD